MSWHDMVLSTPPNDDELAKTAIEICNRLGIQLTPTNINHIVQGIKGLLEKHYS